MEIDNRELDKSYLRAKKRVEKLKNIIVMLVFIYL